MREKLIEYGFSTTTVEQLLKGKKVNVPYGVVKLNKKTGELETIYHRNQEKKVVKL